MSSGSTNNEKALEVRTHDIPIAEAMTDFMKRQDKSFTLLIIILVCMFKSSLMLANRQFSATLFYD